MKIKKRVLRPHRLRRVPQQFSWVDHRLVRQDKYLAKASPHALALYLVLVIVGDSQGLSYYSDSSLQRMLGLRSDQLHEAREVLCRIDLIAYEAPLYQVLSLDEPVLEGARANQSLSAADILRKIAGGVA